MLSIKDLSNILSDVFNTELNRTFIVKGEVFSVTNKGHIWFTLKDEKENYVVNSVIWKSTVEKKGIHIGVGDVIIAKGKINLYQPQNRYNFCVYDLNKKETLENQYNKKLKYYNDLGYYVKNNIIDKKNIKNVALITSLEGEAINDFKKTLSDRIFFGKILLMDVNVQGRNCVNSIIDAIDEVEKKVDLILITRGGGSFMDLNEFNEDLLIQRIFKCKTPLYCAIGHERDYTICDYVCDLRSSTPTSLALEISFDKSILDNKYRLHYETELKKYIDIESSIKSNIDNVKSQIHEFIIKNKPNGFYFDNKYINTLSDFKKLCDEKFKIKLLDCEIEFNIKDYDVLKKYDSKYTYDKYLELYKNPKMIKLDINFKEYIGKFHKNKNFGEKNNFFIIKKLLGLIKRYISNIVSIKNIQVKSSEKVKFIKTDDIELEINQIKKYKKYLNYLENYKPNKINTNINNINTKFIKFMKLDKNKGITSQFLKNYEELHSYNIVYQ